MVFRFSSYFLYYFDVFSDILGKDSYLWGECIYYEIKNADFYLIFAMPYTVFCSAYGEPAKKDCRY